MEYEILTEEIKQGICNRWRVGVKEEAGVAVFEVIACLGETAWGDECGFISYPCAENEVMRLRTAARQFEKLSFSRIVYGHSRSNGKEYLCPSLLKDE